MTPPPPPFRKKGNAKQNKYCFLLKPLDSKITILHPLCSLQLENRLCNRVVQHCLLKDREKETCLTPIFYLFFYPEAQSESLQPLREAVQIVWIKYWNKCRGDNTALYISFWGNEDTMNSCVTKRAENTVIFIALSWKTSAVETHSKCNSRCQLLDKILTNMENTGNLAMNHSGFTQ